MPEPVKPWRVRTSRVVLDDPWLKVRADACETADGASVDPFYVIETADVACGVVLTCDHDIVLVRQYRHGFAGVTLEPPAGRIDPGEDPVAAMQRELLEETGYAGTSARLLRSWSPNTLRYANRMHVVVIRDAVRREAPKDDPLERIETVLWPWARRAELWTLPEFANAALAGALAAGLQHLADAALDAAP